MLEEAELAGSNEVFTATADRLDNAVFAPVPAGAVQVPAPLQYVLALAPVPLFKFPTAKLPVMLEEVPVVFWLRVGKLEGMAVATEVPLPYRIPVTVVSMVIAGVVVGFATVPAKPLAVTTDTESTVPGVSVLVIVVVPPEEDTLIPVPPEMT
jgi:hypothetical protein